MKTLELPKNLVLDYEKWICGRPALQKSGPKAQHGRGFTELLNYNGYMCCLGQFCEQAGVPQKNLRGIATPIKLVYAGMIGYEKYKVGGLVVGGEGKEELTGFSLAAMPINDDSYTSVATKVQNLKALCEEYGYTLELKNFPQDILEQLAQLN